MRIGAVALVAGSLCAAAQAGDTTFPDMFEIQVDWSGGTWLASDNPGSFVVTENTDPQTLKTTYQIEGAFSNADWGASWAISFDPDPFVSSALVSFANMAMMGMQDFVVTVTVPIAPSLAGPTLMTGSVSGFVGDGNGELNGLGMGATVQTFGGQPYYEAQVDGNGVRELYPDSQMHSALQGLTSDIDMVNFLDEVGPGVSSTIGIKNAFSLSAGDSAGFTSTFVIVPSPGSMSLLVLAGVVVLHRRR